MRQLLFSSSYLILFILGLVFLIYLKTLSITIYGGDAGDLASAIITHSFPHPPGYPLYTLVGILFSTIFYFLPFVKRVSLISVFSTIASFYLLFKILQLLLYSKKNKINNKIYFLVLFWLAFNYIIWLYSISIEVFSLNAFITLSILYCSYKYYLKDEKIYLYILFFFIGLGFAHHHTFVLILPTVFYVLFPRILKIKAIKAKTLFLILLNFLLGFSPNLYLFWASLNKSELNWGYVNSFSNFFDVFLRKVYGTFQPGSFITQIFYHRLLQIKNLVVYVSTDFTLVGLFLIILGTYLLFKRKHRLFYGILIAIFMTGPFFMFYSNFPLSTPFSFATLERFLFLFYMLLFFPLYFGLEYIIENLPGKIRYLQSLSQRLLKLGLFTLFFSIVIFLSLRNYNSIRFLSKIKLPELLAQDILNTASPSSLILLNEDTPLFNTQFFYYLNKDKFKKEKKIVLHANKLSFPYYYIYLSKNYPEIQIPNDKNLEGFIKANFKKFNIYSNSRYEFKDRNLRWESYGLLFKLEDKEIFPELSLKKIESNWKKTHLREILKYINNYPEMFKNLFWMDIRKIYAIGLQNSAFTAIKAKKFDKAIEYAELAYTLYPLDPDSIYLQAEVYYTLKNCDKALSLIKKALKLKEDILYYAFLNKIKLCYPDNSPRRKEIQSLLDKRFKTPLQKTL